MTVRGQFPTEPALAETIFDLAPVAIVVASLDGTITSANRRASEVFGYADFAEVNVDDLVPIVARKIHASHRAASGR